MKTFTTYKDPNDVLDYVIIWEELEDDDEIIASTWEVATGLTVEDTLFTQRTATIWLSGGIVNTTVKAVNHIITSGGREIDASITFLIRES